jgi:hypothetical protein
LPLRQDGLTLQIWNGEGANLRPKLLYDPFGMAFLLRADILHAGCYGNPGNIHFHAVLKPNGIEDDGSRLQNIWNHNKCLLRNSWMYPTSVLSHLTGNRHCNFSGMYTERLKESFPSSSFWGQNVTANMPTQQLDPPTQNLTSPKTYPSKISNKCTKMP